MTFPEFLVAVRDGSLGENLSWRAYDIEGHVLPRHTKSALKKLGLTYAGEHAIPEAAARYNVPRLGLNRLLGMWWLLMLAEDGRPHRVPKRQRAG